MSYHYSAKLKIPFEEALSRTVAALKQNGFGIITTINFRNVIHEKLNRDFRNYQILGACNPEFAYEAITLESHVGLMLPCNVIVQEHENGEVEISAINPLETIEKTGSVALLTIAAEVSSRLRKSIDMLHKENAGATIDALPS